MVQLASFKGLVGLFALASCVLPISAAPVVRRQGFSFPELPFAQFQISTTPGGTARQEAAAIFLDPFNGVNLADLDDSIEKNIAAMRQTAEKAETELFNPAIDAASGAQKEALQVGKTKNKVLKHTAFLQLFRIRLAKAQASGRDTSKILADIADRENLLEKNSEADLKNAGKASASPVASEPRPAIGNTGNNNNAPAPQTDAFSFRELPYAQFQISSTPGGTAAEEAEALFLAPFQGVNLADLPDSVERALARMREAAEAAEVDLFNPAIARASGAEAAALEVGKTKNKVLKHTIFLQIFNIRLAKAQAAGRNTASIEADLADRLAKLATNTNLDRNNRGRASRAVV
ncbi:hypothetical protein CC1G_14973 [Coprinopsis cinerea okayama7|uniref:Small secreted protein n=1 Tax=Coprinopsis cinerea (strain Okayama-7 / 130 / ATCC MYA-4618 / FGSC 9003) TaxID=240176 RepID=D6RPA5_COPC7|nr:hypothetical protein CC1G_14973 [Coprinopsis cinerea okayama7\|eukprot:XP_002910642.1 hypothetical protein CC1G_14973 [Coprinopsis cinerea okayama7\